MIEAPVTGEVLSWALRRADLDPEGLAKQLNTTPQKVHEWLTEVRRPSLRQAERLAQECHVPFAYLFLSAPPEDRIPLPDLRTLSNRPITNPSAPFIDVVQDTLRKQDWYREHLEDEGAEPLDFVGRFSVHDNVSAIAADIRNVIGINSNLRRAAANWEDFLDLLARQVEAAGVLVLRSSYVGNNTTRSLDKAEFRGFAFVDPLVPVIFINASDYKSAQIFTLVHELAHIWVGESGVSNLDYDQRSSAQRATIDRVCDRIAAESLVPSRDFHSGWDVGTGVEPNLQRLGITFKVSQFVILRRAREENLINDSQFYAYNESLKSGDRVKPLYKKKKGGDFYKSLPIRNSRLFTATLLSATQSGSVSYRTAARLLNVKPKVLPTAYRKLLENPF